MDPIFRHVAACNNAVLPGDRLLLTVAGQHVGWLDPSLRDPVLAAGGMPADGGVALTPEQLHSVSRALADAGRFPWRGEAFDVRATPDGPVLGTIDRGALPGFGIGAVGVHLNGLVRREGEVLLWVARRAANKPLEPGKLDHLVAGGVPAGLSPWQTLEKEAEEEAGLPAALLAPARFVGTIDYAMERREGLRRDRLHCYDVDLPVDFTPEPRDGEVEAFELWPLPDALDRVRHTDEFKFNVNLVLIELFRRHGLLP